MWNLFLAMKVFQHRTIESFRRELGRNRQLREICGLCGRAGRADLPAGQESKRPHPK
jgi:hypothetical protein